MIDYFRCCWLLALFLIAGDLCFGGSHESQLRIGKSINIFVRYGYLSISMKVISYNDSERWLFKEPTRNIYKEKKESTLSQSFSVQSHTSSIRCVAKGGLMLASGAADERVYIYNMKSRQEIQILSHHSGTVNALAFTPDNSHILTGADDSYLYAISTKNWSTNGKWTKGKPIESISCHPSGKAALTLGSDSILRTWNLVKGRMAYAVNLKKNKIFGYKPQCVKWSSDGEHFVLLGTNGMEIYNAASGSVCRSESFQTRSSSVCWKDNKVCVVGLENGKLIFVDINKSIENINLLTETKEETSPGIFHGDFHMEFCDNRRQLYQAYFRDFTIERLDRPWEAFTAGWHPELAAKKLGINTSFIRGDYSYVLVRVSRFRESGKLKKTIPLNQPLENDVSERITSMKIGNITAAAQFMYTYGTHYISSYTTGNSLYQVFVYNKMNYQLIKERLKTKGISALSRLDLYNFFAPWYAQHLGQIRAASGNTTVERWARRKLQYQYYVFKYATLLKLHGNGTLLRALDDLLGTEAIIQLDLKALNTVFKEPEKRRWFHEVLDNYMKLWEVNMGVN